MKAKQKKIALLFLAVIIIASVSAIYMYLPARMFSLVEDYPYQTKFNIKEMQNMAHTNVPIKIQLNSTTQYFDFGYISNINAYDVLFADENDVTLKHYIEYFNKALKKAIFWVQIPSLSASQAKIIYMYSGISVTSDPRTYDPRMIFTTNQDFENEIIDTKPAGWTGDVNAAWKTVSGQGGQGSICTKWYDAYVGASANKLVTWYGKDSLKFLFRVQPNSGGGSGFSKYFMLYVGNGVYGLTFKLYIADYAKGSIFSVEDSAPIPKYSGAITYDNIWYSANFFFDWANGIYYLKVWQVDPVQKVVFSSYGYSMALSSSGSKMVFTSPPSCNYYIFIDAISTYQYMLPEAYITTSDIPPEYKLVIIEPATLSYPENTERCIVKVRYSYGSAPLQYKQITMEIQTNGDYIEHSFGGSTDLTGVASIEFTSPPTKGVLYSVLFSAGTVGIDYAELSAVLSSKSALVITPQNLKVSQSYDLSRNYDLFITCKVTDSVGSPVFYGSGNNQWQVDILKMSYNGIDLGRGTYYTDIANVGEATFEIRGKIYDKYRDSTARSIFVEVKLRSVNYYTTFSNYTITMSAPTINIQINVPTRISVGTEGIVITLSDANIEDFNVVVSYLTDSTDKIYNKGDVDTVWSPAVKQIYVAYKFEKIGDYKITVTVYQSGLPIEKQSPTIQAVEGGFFGVNPYYIVVGAVVVLGLLIWLSRRGKKEEYAPV